ncbi:MAG: DUF469 family protein [Burkholderiales bacterium]|nr:DUF469 family protein [Burkholderiales bacterium]
MTTQTPSTPTSTPTGTATDTPTPPPPHHRDATRFTARPGAAAHLTVVTRYTDDATNAQIDALMTRLRHQLASLGLCMGGDLRLVFAMGVLRDPTEQDRVHLKRWLQLQPELAEVVVGSLRQAAHHPAGRWVPTVQAEDLFKSELIDIWVEERIHVAWAQCHAALLQAWLRALHRRRVGWPQVFERLHAMSTPQDTGPEPSAKPVAPVAPGAPGAHRRRNRRRSR